MCLLCKKDLAECGMSGKSHVLVAFSGGADSTALMLLMEDCVSRGLIKKVSAAHFNHGLRGTDSESDAAFCEEFCAEHHIPFYAGSGDVSGFARKQGKGLEAAARTLRYDFLSRIMLEIGADCVVTAHHADDQAETVLQHLIRGCGPGGLCGMESRSGWVARPLLKKTHGELVAYLEKNGQTFRVDASNYDESFSRNRVRNSLIPSLRELQPEISGHLCALSDDMKTDETYFSSVVTEVIRRAEQNGGYRRDVIAEQPEAVRRRVLRKILNDVTESDFSRTDIRKVEELLLKQSGRRVELSGGREAWNDGETLFAGVRTRPSEFKVSLCAGEDVDISGWRIRLERTDSFRKPENGMEAFICGDRLDPERFLARTKQRGDRFQPLGMQDQKLLSDIFTDRKVPEKYRGVPLICNGDMVVFVPGYTVSEQVRVRGNSTNIYHIIVEETEKC